jgi:hypothetical protein
MIIKVRRPAQGVIFLAFVKLRRKNSGIKITTRIKAIKKRIEGK